VALFQEFVRSFELNVEVVFVDADTETNALHGQPLLARFVLTLLLFLLKLVGTIVDNTRNWWFRLWRYLNEVKICFLGLSECIV